MILVDVNQIMISNLMVSIKPMNNSDINEDLIRHMVISSLRHYENKFSEEYGELILCYDSKHYWRKDYFSYYKATRKKDREDSKLNWGAIFDLLNKIRDEIRENLHYKVVEVYGAEADDVIAILAKHFYLNNQERKTLILSGDKDMGQLQKYSTVFQFNPSQKKFIEQENPDMFLKEHIVKGDRSDGIPNFLSDDDTFVSSKRQKPISKKNIDKWINFDPEKFCNTEQLKNYHRNKTLIDFDCIPKDLENKIIECYNSIKEQKKSIKLNYFIQHRMSKLLSEFN
jgi:5'-3' exonuclease